MRALLPARVRPRPRVCTRSYACAPVPAPLPAPPRVCALAHAYVPALYASAPMPLLLLMCPLPMLTPLLPLPRVCALAHAYVPAYALRVQKPFLRSLTAINATRRGLGWEKGRTWLGKCERGLATSDYYLLPPPSPSLPAPSLHCATEPSLLVTYAILLVCLSSFLYLLFSYIGFNDDNNVNKYHPYECGYTATVDLDSAMMINFYVIAVLFLVFDIEIAILMPLVLNFSAITWLSAVMAIAFLGILMLGFGYEIIIDAIDWTVSDARNSKSNPRKTMVPR